MNAMPDREPLDDLLDQSSPGTAKMTDSVLEELTRLRVTSQPSTSQPTARKKRWARPAVIGLATIIVLGGAGAAAAASTGLWSPWAQDPDATLNYTLPSGAECEIRVGNAQGTDPRATAAVEHFYQTTDIDALLTDKAMKDTIAQLRTEESTFTNADGTTEPAGYGTEHYSADREYDSALSRIISNALSKELARQNIDGADSNLSYDGEGSCPGADW